MIKKGKGHHNDFVMTINSERSAHIVAHILIGFTYAHLMRFVNWIYLFIILIVVLAIKEYIDTVVDPPNKWAEDILHYVGGFLFYVLIWEGELWSLIQTT
jgi:hypothetical protein